MMRLGQTKIVIASVSEAIQEWSGARSWIAASAFGLLAMTIPSIRNLLYAARFVRGVGSFGRSNLPIVRRGLSMAGGASLANA